MALNETQQLFESLNRAKDILVAFRRDGTVDAVGSALAISGVLRRMGKSVETVSQDFIPQPQTAFLTGVDSIKPAILGLQKFVIMINTDKISLANLQTHRDDKEVRLEMLPHQGMWSSEDVKTEKLPFRFDLIVTVDTPDLESLGTLRSQHPDFFATQPIIYIDHDPKNEHYGHIICVDIAASSTAEVVWNLFSGFDRATIDADAATALITGIIAQTDRFTSPRVTPRTLTIAAELVSMGAKRSEVIANLYRTRNVSGLRLWGRALARLQHDAARKLVWTVLTRQDFSHAGAKENELPGIVEELIFSSPDAQVVVLLYEQESGGICGLLHCRRPHDARALSAHFGSEGRPDYARFCLMGASLVDAEREVIEKVRTMLSA